MECQYDGPLLQLNWFPFVLIFTAKPVSIYTLSMLWSSEEKCTDVILRRRMSYYKESLSPVRKEGKLAHPDPGIVEKEK